MTVGIKQLDIRNRSSKFSSAEMDKKNPFGNEGVFLKKGFISL
jgi:hypothetical protein